MHILKKTINVLVSLRTAIWLMLAMLCLLFYGAVAMPLQEEFLALHEIPLFQWMIEHPARITWWLWAVLAALSFLTANTLLCSIESVFRKRESRQWLLIISPQVIHVGFLFILVAHLFSSYGGFKGTAFAYRDTIFQLPNGLEVKFDEVRADIAPEGYVKDWSADISYFRDGNYVSSDVIKPNDPSLREGLGIYIKEVRTAPFPVALIEVSREPGALWALIGGILFTLGMSTLLVLKIRREDDRELRRLTGQKDSA